VFAASQTTAASMCSARRSGEVGCSSTTMSVSNPFEAIASIACRSTGSMGASSVASNAGRMNGTSRPSDLAQSAIRASSVLTIVLVRDVLAFTRVSRVCKERPARRAAQGSCSECPSTRRARG
jgi:hypothetical protein